MPDSSPKPSLVLEVQGLLQARGTTEINLHAVLDVVMDHFDGAVGTIHALDANAGLLSLRAQEGIPDSLRDRVANIPIGKGMAGLAAQRREPVQVCNLQTDTSGVAKPAAKDTQMEGSIAVPILDGELLRGVLGVGKPVAHEFSAAEIALLQEVAVVLGKYLGR